MAFAVDLPPSPRWPQMGASRCLSSIAKTTLMTDAVEKVLDEGHER
jgi:hypothetical protein